MRTITSNLRIAASLIAACHFGNAAGGDLFVFYPTTTRPQAVQTRFEEAYPGVTTTVFGRYADFQARREGDGPDAILVHPSLLTGLDDYVVELRGTREGAVQEEYVVLRVRATAGQTVGVPTVMGVVDFLGRAGMESFVAGFLGTATRLKRVTKVEDLLPLLSFNMAEAILATRRHAEYLSATSNQAFDTRPLPSARTGIVVIALRKGKSSDGGRTVDLMRAMPGDLLGVLGIDGWK